MKKHAREAQTKKDANRQTTKQAQTAPAPRYRFITFDEVAATAGLALAFLPAALKIYHVTASITKIPAGAGTVKPKKLNEARRGSQLTLTD